MVPGQNKTHFYFQNVAIKHVADTILNHAREYDKGGVKVKKKKQHFLHSFRRTLSGLLKLSTDLESHVALQQNNKKAEGLRVRSSGGGSGTAQ